MSNASDPGFQNIPNQQVDSYLINAAAHVPGIKNESVVEYYNDWADKYDNTLNYEVYRGPKIAANFCDILTTDKNAEILDIGAGTGFVGQYLSQHGFKNVDALEPSKGMLEIAEKKKVYRNFYLEGISKDKPTSRPEGSYDAIVLAGAFGEGHIPSEGVIEFARLAKKGGFVIIVMRKEYLTYVQEYVDRLVPLMDKLEKDGVWTNVVKLDVPNYSFNKTGIVFVYQKN